MASEWQTVKIEEIAERVAMGPFGSSIKVETFVPSGVPVISGQHLHGSKVDDAVGYNFITPEHAEELRHANVQRGDIIFTHAGNIGQVAYIPENSKYERYVISQRQFYLRPNRFQVIPQFVVAYFKTAEGQHKLLANASPVGVPSIAQPVTYLRTVEIPLPPLPEQRAIAHILGTLDDKIELNRRMCETLEEMARALFKSWFVDFDPVRFKMRHPSPTGRGVRGEGVKSEKPPLPEELLQFAREMRKKATDAESLLWRLLRNRQLSCSKFRRQHPFPPYILDFYCNELRLAIEVDGGHHTNSEIRRYDQRRTAFLEENGIRVLRFWDNEVLKDTEAVLQAIYEAVEGQRKKLLPSPPAPLPLGEGWQWPREILDLFPDRLVDSELGKIPEGWKVGTMSNQFRITMGQSPPGTTYNDCGNGLPFYQGGVDFGFRFPARRVFCTAPTRFAEPKDTLVTIRAPVGDVNMALERCAIGRGIAAIRHTTGSCSYTYYFLKSLRRVFWNFEAEGTVFGAISKEGFDSIQHVVPPRSLIKRFETICKPLDDEVELKEVESRTLAALRDALLPKLISGEIRVKDAEKIVGKDL